MTRFLIDLSVAPLGGSRTFADGFSAGLAEVPLDPGDDYVVLVEQGWAGVRADTIDALRQRGVLVEVLELPPAGTWKARLLRGRTSRAAVKRHRPDISFFPREVAPRGIHPYVVFAHNRFAWVDSDLADAVGGPLTVRLLQRAARRSGTGAAAVISVTESIASEVRSHGVPVHSIVHLGCFLPEPSEVRPIDRDRPVASTVGNVIAHKRFDLAVQGVAAARADGTDWHLDLWGGTSDREHATELDALAGTLLGAPVIRGPLDREQLAATYQRSDVLISTSTFESFSLPLVEAMRSGCVVVAPASPLVEELCGDAAVTYAEGDVDALGRALSRALADHDEHRRRGIERARRYTWAHTVEGILEVLRAVS